MLLFIFYIFTYINTYVNICVSGGYKLNIIYTKSYNNSFKKLKNHHKEKEELNDILDYLRSKKSFSSIIDDSISKVYGFERLKYQYSDFYSMRLSKTIRLIIRPRDNDIELYLIYISTKHYDDFDLGKVIYDE